MVLLGGNILRTLPGIPFCTVVACSWVSGIYVNLCSLKTLYNFVNSQNPQGAKSGE